MVSSHCPMASAHRSSFPVIQRIRSGGFEKGVGSEADVGAPTAEIDPLFVESTGHRHADVAHASDAGAYLALDPLVCDDYAGARGIIHGCGDMAACVGLLIYTSGLQAKSIQIDLEPSPVECLECCLGDVLNLCNNLARDLEIGLETRLHWQQLSQHRYARDDLHGVEHDNACAEQINQAYDEMV